MYRWDDLRVFLAVMKEKSFTKAGALLQTNQSTVSRRIASLEQALGLVLFDRTPDGLLPTQAAKQIATEAEVIEQATHQIARLVEGRDAACEGVVRLAVSDGVGAHLIAPVLPHFYRQYPNIQLELVSGNAVLDLSRREADLAFRFVRPTQGDLVFKMLAQCSYGIYINYALWKSLGQPTDLAQLPWLAWDTSLSHLPEAQWHNQVVGVSPVLRSNHMGTLLNAALSGVGALPLVDLFAQWMPQLTKIPVHQPMPRDMQIWLVGHRTLRHVPRIQAVWNFLEELVHEVSHVGLESTWFHGPPNIVG